ncbi:hypothetical protein BJX61DRAFT_403951 [Aspergillus egyptiacus]|nr:hypothetical protein BJX61DRAFT_403951 [Aspergillus egyptiacus]
MYSYASHCEETSRSGFSMSTVSRIAVLVLGYDIFFFTPLIGKNAGVSACDTDLNCIYQCVDANFEIDLRKPAWNLSLKYSVTCTIPTANTCYY